MILTYSTILHFRSCGSHQNQQCGGTPQPVPSQPSHQSGPTASSRFSSGRSRSPQLLQLSAAWGLARDGCGQSRGRCPPDPAGRAPFRPNGAAIGGETGAWGRAPAGHQSAARPLPGWPRPPARTGWAGSSPPLAKRIAPVPGMGGPCHPQGVASGWWGRRLRSPSRIESRRVEHWELSLSEMARLCGCPDVNSRWVLR